MQLTEVRINRLPEEGGKVKASATITLDDEFVVHGLRVVEGQHGLFVSMPGRRADNGEYRDIAHPITSEFRATIQTGVLEAYFAEL